MGKFWNVTGGSSDAVLGVPIYGRKKRVWHNFTIMPLYRIGRSIRDAKFWIFYRVHPKHRYHIINTGLEPGYYDEDTLILHGCFAMLERYIEWHGGDSDLEKFSKDLLAEPDKNAPPGLQSHQGDSQLEAVKLYRWWKVEKPADEKLRDDLMMKLYGDKKRVSFVPTDHPQLQKMEFTPFEGDEIAIEKEFRALEKKIEDDEQAMLHRLIDIRPGLWT
jgi:hypothetical protein